MGRSSDQADVRGESQGGVDRGIVRFRASSETLRDPEAILVLELGRFYRSGINDQPRGSALDSGSTPIVSPFTRVFAREPAGGSSWAFRLLGVPSLIMSTDIC